MKRETMDLLRKIAAKWPEALKVAPEPPELMELREADLVEQWDMHPNGDRTWTVTKAGRELATSGTNGDRA